MFIDSDDFVPPGSIKSLLNTIIREEADLIVSNFLIFYPHYDFIERRDLETLPFIFAKIYKMSAIGGLRFSNVKLLEDLTFNLMFLDQPKKVFYETRTGGLYFHYIKENSLTSKAEKSDDYQNSLSYYMLLAIYKYLQYSKQIAITDSFISRYIINNLYALYEEGIVYCPNNKKEFDILTNKILADKRVQNLFNDVFLYATGSTCFCSQYALAYNGRDYQTAISTNQVHFFNETIIDFFKNHGYNPNIDFNLLNNDINLYKI